MDATPTTCIMETDIISFFSNSLGSGGCVIFYFSILHELAALDILEDNVNEEVIYGSEEAHIAAAGTTEGDKVPDQHPIFCDLCETNERSIAVCYCKVCDEKLCKHHEEVSTQGRAINPRTALVLALNKFQFRT